ncbi:MAG: hypothetical protein L3J59_11835 [Methylococcaceae bacterium]|nr:hypothetical protein [Methylococcaceae bacterium]
MKIIITNKKNIFYIENNKKDLHKELPTKSGKNSLLSFKKKFSRYKPLALVTILLSLFFSSTATAHRGAKNEIDTCRISVGNEVVHFSAYTPILAPGASYCHNIPELGLTHLVIDYEGKKLRNTTVEFEVTKEPEGTRIFYQEPQKIKKGSMDAKIDFTPFGIGEYLTHITIMHEGEKLDSHLPFTVGIEEDNTPYKLIIPIILIIITWITVQVKTKNREYSSGDHLDT